MKTRNSTKSKLLSSVIALVLCVSMLIGATFAWFTDTASTGVNKIQAGTLNVEVEYSTNGTSWATIEDATSLFSNNLWEPGHTEYVYLRVKNAGTLGLKYKVMVTPVSENGGINVNNANFKLSDYLVFGTTDPSVTPVTYADRTAARNAVGTAMGLDQATLTKTGRIEANRTEQYDYLALVVYMPETVGNEANAKPGTVAPSINLGITVVATQLEAENDSFDNTYDHDAVNDSKYVAGAYYDYFEAVNATTNAAEDGTFTVTKRDDNSGIIASASGTAAAGAKVNMVITKTSTPANNFGIVVNNDEELNGYDIKVTGQDTGSLVQGKLYVGTGLVNFKFYHNGLLMTLADSTVADFNKNNLADGSYYYDTTDGYVYFATTSFSPFQATYKAPVAAINTAVYGTVSDAFAAVKSGETITLLKDSAGNGIVVPSGSNFAVDFNSYTYDVNGELVGSSGTETNSLQLLKDSTITFKNGTLTSSNSTYASQILIQNYSNLTLDNMTVSAGTPFDYIVSNNNGNVVIKDTTINAAEGKVAFDVCRYASYTGPVVTIEGNSVINGNVEISSSGAMEGATHQLNVTGGTFNGKFVKYDSPNFVGNITGGTFATDPNAFCADGYCALPEGGVYQIVEGCLVSNKNELVAAAAGTCSTIYLNKDINVGRTVAINRDVTLDGQGHTLTAGFGVNTVIDIQGAVDVTLKNTNIKFGYSGSNCGVQASGTGNRLSFENVNITNAFKAIHFIDCRDTVVSIKGCTLTSDYPFNVNGGNVKSFVVEDSSLNGWTSYSNSTQCTYTFKNTNFGKGNGYATVKPYGNTTFEGCTFSADYFNSLEGGIASGTETPITVNFNNCFVKATDGTTQALTIDLLKTAFNYDITSGSSSGDSTINDQYWYVNGERISFVTENS